MTGRFAHKLWRVLATMVLAGGTVLTVAPADGCNPDELEGLLTDIFDQLDYQDDCYYGDDPWEDTWDDCWQYEEDDVNAGYLY